jgi:HAD superfamily hydrolase (TIGR01549 family)
MICPPQAILLDMDGTITRPMLDFARIRLEMGIGNQQPILETMEQRVCDRLDRAREILLKHEQTAAENSTLNDGCETLLEVLADHRIKTALITRNSRQSMQTVLSRHNLFFDVLISREDGQFKPDPRPLLLACEKLTVSPADAWMVGDGQYDVEAGLAAGCPTVWIAHGRPRPFAAIPWQCVDDLAQLTRLIENCLSH